MIGVEEVRKMLKIEKYGWVKPLNGVKTFMVIVKGDYSDVLRRGISLAKEIAKKHGCKTLHSKSVAPIEDGDSYKMVFHFI